MQVNTTLVGGRLSKQIRRALPIYVAFILIMLYFMRPDSLGPSLGQNPSDVLRKVMAYQAMLRGSGHAGVESKFPRKIWQTWKVAPYNFEEREINRARSWTQLNPGFRYEVLTDGNDLAYVEDHFGPNGVVNRPDIVETYRSLTAQIIKADLLRYLVMYVEGGVYADIDVEALRPVDTWIPSNFTENEIDLVISVEIDEPNWFNHTILGPKSESFCQWTFMNKPRSPALLRIIENVLKWLKSISEAQNVPISDITLNFDEVLTGTGPSAWTTAIMSEMQAQTKQAEIPWSEFHNMTEPKQVGSILVLTVKAFAAGQGHSDSGNHEAPEALVRHHYHASSWPKRHPRFSHPAYGMVEECNWHADCVNTWDANMAGWDSLGPEQQAEAIEAHEQVLRERLAKEEAEAADREREAAEKKAAELKANCEAANFIPGPDPVPTPTGAAQADSTQVVVTNPDVATLAENLAKFNPDTKTEEAPQADAHPDPKN